MAPIFFKEQKDEEPIYRLNDSHWEIATLFHEVSIGEVTIDKGNLASRCSHEPRDQDVSLHVRPFCRSQHLPAPAASKREPLEQTAASTFS